MIVYHGSDHIIEVPIYNGSKRTNDYGYGFYTTESLELAKEWACSDNTNSLKQNLPMLQLTMKRKATEIEIFCRYRRCYVS